MPDLFDLGSTGPVLTVVAFVVVLALLLSYGGVTHDLSATADRDIPAGSVVLVTDGAGSMLVVTLAAQAQHEGGTSNA